MKLIKFVILFLFISARTYSQNLDSLQKKFANNVCGCIGHVDKYSELKPLIDKCYENTMNFIFNGATPQEIKFYSGAGNLKLVSQKLEYYLKSTCPDVVRVIKEYVTPYTNENNYPTNFNQETLKKAKEDLISYYGKTIAFDAEIVKINKSDPNKIFLKVRFQDGQTIWVGDMANSDFEIVGNKVRFLGYFIMADKNSDEEYNQSGYLVVSFSSVELTSNKLAMYPGSEKQIHAWVNGKVPELK